MQASEWETCGGAGILFFAPPGQSCTTGYSPFCARGSLHVAVHASVTYMTRRNKAGVENKVFFKKN